MLVIHPKDSKNSCLSLLYNGANATLLDQSSTKCEIDYTLRHCPQSERVMLLGHGSNNGLFSRTDDIQEEFDRIIVGHPQAYHLRKHKGNIIGIWCNADKFARREGLHGLFTGRIMLTREQACRRGIITLQMHIDDANEIMFNKLRNLLDEQVPLHEIPQIMKTLYKGNFSVSGFNYNNFYYF